MPSSTHNPWHVEHAPRLFDAVGVRAGMVVVDGGCRQGLYAVELAHRVGADGIVLGIDNNRDALSEFAVCQPQAGDRRAVAICADLCAGLSLKDGTVDCFFLYDMLQMLHEVERRKLYRRVAAALKLGGILSVHLPHYGDQSRARLLKGMVPEDVYVEIQECGFTLRDMFEGTVGHGDGVMEGRVGNFVAVEAKR